MRFVEILYHRESETLFVRTGNYSKKEHLFEEIDKPEMNTTNGLMSTPVQALKAFIAVVSG